MMKPIRKLSRVDCFAFFQRFFNCSFLSCLSLFVFCKVGAIVCHFYFLAKTRISSQKCESLNSYFLMTFLLNNESWRPFVNFRNIFGWVQFDIEVVIYINYVWIFINHSNNIPFKFANWSWCILWNNFIISSYTFYMQVRTNLREKKILR